MNSIKFLLFTLLIFLSTSLFSKEEIPVIKVAAIDWCPQICPEQEAPGYVHELVTTVFKGQKYRLKIDYFPWSRAIKNVLSGNYHALLAPAKAEAPLLRYPQTPVGKQDMCFFTRRESSWYYRGVPSLTNMQIGIAIDTSIEELNEFVAAHPGQFQFQPYHERYILQSAKKLEKRRIDAFLFTYNSTRYELQRAGVWNHYQQAGCVSSANIYLAFTPAPSHNQFVTELIEVFDKKMQDIDHAAVRHELLLKYGLF